MAVIEQWVGLDVCKRWLDVPLRPQGARFRVSHNESGRQALLKRLQVPGSVGRLLWEATGGSERQAALQWWALDYPVVVMHARQARNFAKAAKQLAKPDPVAAASLAWFGEALKPPLRPFASQAQAPLQDLVTRRRQLVARLTAEQNRLSGLRGTAQADVEAHLAWRLQRVQPLEAPSEGQIQPCQEWQAKHTRLQSVSGVGQVVAATLWALLPARGQLSTPPMSPLVGVAPRKRDSGPRQGKRTLAGGRAAVRQRLYRATLVAVRPHPVIQAVDDQWRQRGEATKVALVACRHSY